MRLREVDSKINSCSKVTEMKLNEFVDKNGNKINTSSPAVSTSTSKTSSGSFKKKFEKLLNYAQAHKNASVSTTTVNSISDNEFSYSEKIRGGYSYYDREIQVYIGSQTEAWRLKIYIDNKIDEDLAGQGWPELLKTLRYYITVPVTTTPEYKELLTEWVDRGGKKVDLNNSPAPTTATKTNKEKFTELVSYMQKHKDSSVIFTSVNGPKDTGFEYEEQRAFTNGNEYNLSLEVECKSGNLFFIHLDIDGNRLATKSAVGWEDLLLKIKTYFHVPKTGSPEYKSLTESFSSIAEDFKAYENLWD